MQLRGQFLHPEHTQSSAELFGASGVPVRPIAAVPRRRRARPASLDRSIARPHVTREITTVARDARATGTGDAARRGGAMARHGPRLMGSNVQRAPVAPSSSRAVSSLKALAVFACVACVAASRARGAHAATWPLVKERGVNVVEVENRDGGAMTIRASGGTSIRADAIVIEGDAYAEYEDTYDSVSARVYEIESALETLRAALSAADGALANNVTTCLEGKAALLDGLDQLELDITSRRFTPPTCNHASGARNLIYVFDASAGHNVWQCVCKGDYTGTNCDVPPCDVSTYDLSGTCSGRKTMSGGESCDIDCGDGRVQTEPLKCTTSSDGLSTSLNAVEFPCPKTCDDCTACIGPDQAIAMDYTAHTGVNCAIPPCLTSSTTKTLTGACAADADGLLPAGTTCDFDCAADTVQSDQMTCTFDGTASVLSDPPCEPCVDGYTGANCVTAPCDLAAWRSANSDMASKITTSDADVVNCFTSSYLPVGAVCNFYCDDSVMNEPLTCSEGGVLNAPECKACDECAACIDYSGNTRDYTGYSGDNCYIAPNCALTAPADGSLGGCGDTLNTSSSCVFSCDDGYYVSQATTCSSEAILTTGRCLRLLWNIQGSTGSVGIDGNEGTFGSAIWNQGGDSSYRGIGREEGDPDEEVRAGSRLWYYVAYAMSVDTDGYYHVGVYAKSDRDNDVLLVYESDTFQPSKPGLPNLKYGNDYAQIGNENFGEFPPWWDGLTYNNKPSCFVELEAAKSYTIVYMPYNSAEVIPDTIAVVCGNPDRDGRSVQYGYGVDNELLDDTEYVRGECTMTAGVINDL